jgi:excinuclease ABC subunit A
MEVDPELVVSDPDKTLAEGAIDVWSGGHVNDYFMRLIEALGDALGFSIDTPWARLPAAAQHALLHGHDQQVHVQYTTRNGRERSYYARFEGAIPYIERRHDDGKDEASRDWFAGSCARCPARPAAGPG